MKGLPEKIDPSANFLKALKGPAVKEGAHFAAAKAAPKVATTTAGESVGKEN